MTSVREMICLNRDPQFLHCLLKSKNIKSKKIKREENNKHPNSNGENTNFILSPPQMA